MIQEILLLGNPKLYEVSGEVTEQDWKDLPRWVEDLHDTLMEYRRTYGAGRAVAAPQIGIQKRLLYMYLDKPYVFVNPVLLFPDEETYELMDDCMSFPGLMVKVRRHKRAVIRYRDEHNQPGEMALEGDLSELLQHEYDHLDGILATMRAVDDRSLFYELRKRNL